MTTSTLPPSGITAGAACEFGPLATRRKRLAFACNCADRIAGAFADPRVRAAVTCGHAFTRGEATLPELVAAVRHTEAAAAEAWDRRTRGVWTIPEAQEAARAEIDHRAARAAADALGWAIDPRSRAWPADELRGAAGHPRRLIGEIAAGRWSPPALNRDWLTGNVLGLAEYVRHGNAPDLLPILADALMDAGCDDEAVLNHCRDDAPHGPGCWVLDWLRGE